MYVEVSHKIQLNLLRQLCTLSHHVHRSLKTHIQPLMGISDHQCMHINTDNGDVSSKEMIGQATSLLNLVKHAIH